MLDYVPLRKPAIAGVIATAPGLKPAIENQKFKVILAKVMGKMIPTLSVDSGLDTSTIWRDPKLAEEYISDPLVHRRVTASWGKSMLDATRIAFENTSAFPSPVLLMHGTKDETAAQVGSQIFADLTPKGIVTLKMWDGFKHDLHTDPESSEVFKVMIDWLNKNLVKDIR